MINPEDCIGKAVLIYNNKIVFASKDIKEVIEHAKKYYSDKVVTLSSVPRPDRIWI